MSDDKQENPVTGFFNKNGVGEGTQTGLMVGAGLGLLFGLFSSNDSKGGFFSTLFAVIIGGLLGGLAGDFIKKDGPLFSGKSGSPAPDGTEVEIRKLETDKAPTTNKAVELDYSSALKDTLKKSGMDDDVANAIGVLSKRGRLLLKTGESNDKSVTFTGAFLPNNKELIEFKTPVELPVKDGKVDYALAGTLAAMRLAEKKDLSIYEKMNDFDGLKTTYSGILNQEQQLALNSELYISALMKEGTLPKSLADEIIKNSVKDNGTLNIDFLEKNKEQLGITHKKSMMVAIDGDNVNIAMGKPSADGKKIGVDKVLVLNAKTIAKDIDIDKLLQPGKFMGILGDGDIDLRQISAKSAANSPDSPAITYRKAENPVEINLNQNSSKLPIGFGNIEIDKVNAGDVNKATKEIVDNKKTSSLDNAMMFSNLNIPSGQKASQAKT